MSRDKKRKISEYKPSGGEGIRTAVGNAIRLSKKKKGVVRLRFNGVSLVVSGKRTRTAVVNEYFQKFEARAHRRAFKKTFGL